MTGGNIAIITLVALLPVAILLYYIYRKDQYAPEPPRELIKAFMLGILSAPLSMALSLPFEAMGLYSLEGTSMMDGVRSALFGAAIPEEVAKFLLLWVALRRNSYFDEAMDGIVYAVCISLGFAMLENLLYLFANPDSYMAIGTGRALFAIPGHFCFGIMMGYYYSLARFYPHPRRRYAIFALLIPVFVHALYDTLLFVADLAPALSGILVVLFLIFCHRLWKYAHGRIEEHLMRDMEK